MLAFISKFGDLYAFYLLIFLRGEGDYKPKHVWHNKESNMRTPNVYLVEMTDTAVASSNCNILQLYIHVVLGYNHKY